MLRKILVGVGSVVFLLLGFWGVNAEEMKPFLYSQDFEGEADPVEFWTSAGKFVINFKGLTDEKAFSGKKSFKLDVTLHDDGHFYWKSPVKYIPTTEGKLKFSGRILIEKGTTGNAGLGCNIRIPEMASGCKSFGSADSRSAGKWKLIEGDVVKLSKKIAEETAPKHIWGAKGENVSTYVDNIGLFLHGKKGQRVVVYVDDIKIEGELPTKADHQKEIKRRWALVKERVDKKIAMWEEALKKIEEEINSLTDLSPKVRKEIEKKIGSVKTKIAVIKKRGKIVPSEVEEIDGLLKNISSHIKSVPFVSAKEDMLVYVVSPITSLKILPADTFVPGEIFGEIRVIAAPGEYEPASFVVSALSDIVSLKVKVTDLKGDKGFIPASAVDIKVVKCWYQSGGAWTGVGYGSGQRILVPELLLHDDSLVKVDHEKKENYVKLNYPDGEKYVCISNPEKVKSWKIISIEDFPVKDSRILFPVDIPANTNKQFWMTIHVPDDAESGVYTGKIRLSNPKEILTDITLKLKVLPFALSQPYYISSIFYRGKLSPKYLNGTISSEYKSEKQLRAELENMFSHGVTNPTCYQYHADSFLTKYLQIRNEIGMRSGPLYSNMSASKPDGASKMIAIAKEYGISTVYFEGRDEAKGERLKAQRKAWTALRKVGGKVFVAGYKDENFEAMGDIQDLLICAGYPSKEEAKKWHSVGHKIFCYANPQVGVENPAVYRRNFGLLLWENDYDGAMNYAYQHSFGDIWNDFDHSGYRDHNFTYPTVDGVIDTIAWEGYREGVDDVRYLTTLLETIERAKKSGDRKIRNISRSAQTYINTLKVEGGRDLNTVRYEIINYILNLNEGNRYVK